MAAKKVYQFFIGVAILLFGIRLVTDFQPLSALGALFLLGAYVAKVCEDYKSGKIGSKKHKAKVGQK